MHSHAAIHIVADRLRNDKANGFQYRADGNALSFVEVRCDGHPRDSWLRPKTFRTGFGELFNRFLNAQHSLQFVNSRLFDGHRFVGK